MAVLCESTVFSFRVKSWNTSGFNAFEADFFLDAPGIASGAVKCLFVSNDWKLLIMERLCLEMPLTNQRCISSILLAIMILL